MLLLQMNGFHMVLTCLAQIDNNKNIQYSQRWGTQPQTTTSGGGEGGAAPGIMTWYRRRPFGVTAVASHGAQDQGSMCFDLDGV